MIKKFESDLAIAEQEYNQLVTQKEQVDYSIAEINALKDKINTFANMFSMSDMATKKRLLATVIGAITVYKDRVVIHFNVGVGVGGFNGPLTKPNETTTPPINLNNSLGVVVPTTETSRTIAPPRKPKAIKFDHVARI